MQITFVTGLALTLAWALATVLPPISATHRSLHRRTLDPAESNSKGMKPVDIDWYVFLSHYETSSFSCFLLQSDGMDVLI